MRNNSNRFVAPTPEDGDISAQMANNKSDLLSVNSEGFFDFTTPTEFVDLPSQGRHYPEGHVLSNVESVEIRFMTAKDEDILTSKSLIKQGVVIDRLVDNLVVDKRIKAADMLSGDKNAILVAARSTAFGSNYSTKVTCPSCGGITEYEFDLSEIKPKERPDLEQLNVEETEDGTFVFETPRTKVQIEIRILSSKEETALLQGIEKRSKKGLPESPLTSLLNSIIVSVNGSKNNVQIYKFIENLPSQDSRHIKSIYQKIIPSLNMKQDFSCSNCSFNQEVDIPITVDFFWFE